MTNMLSKLAYTSIVVVYKLTTTSKVTWRGGLFLIYFTPIMSLFIVVSTITRHYATQIIKPTCSNSIYHLSRVFLKGFHYIYHHFLSTVQYMQIPLTSTLSDAKTPKFQEKACLKWSLDIPPWLAQLLCSSCHIFLFEMHRDPFLWPPQYPGNAFQILPPGPSLLLRFCWKLLRRFAHHPWYKPSKWFSVLRL